MYFLEKLHLAVYKMDLKLNFSDVFPTFSINQIKVCNPILCVCVLFISLCFYYIFFMGIPLCICGSQDCRDQFSPSSMWLTGMELEVSGVAAIAFGH